MTLPKTLLANQTPQERKQTEILTNNLTTKLNIMTTYKIGQKVKYVGSGFIGFDKDCTEMTIIKKCPNYLNDWIVKYKDFELSVMSHEIQSK